MNDIEKESSYLRRGSVLIISIFIGGFIASYFFNVVISRILGPHDYGDFKVAEAFTSLGCVLVLMGGSKAVARFLPDQIRNQNGEGVWEYTRFYIKVILISSSILITAVYFGHEYHLSIVDGDSYHPILLASLAIPVAAMSALLGGILQVAKRIDLAFIPWQVGNPLMRLALCGFYFWVFGEMSSFQAIAITLITSISVALLSLFFIHRLSLMPIKRTGNSPQHKEWLRVSTPMMFIVVMQMMMMQSDIYMIEYISGETAVGHFAAAQTTAKAVSSIQMALFALVTPLIVTSLASGHLSVVELNRRGFLMMVKVVLPIAITISYFGHPILKFYGHDTETAHLTMQTLIIGYSVSSILGFAALWLQYSGNEKSVLTVLICTVAINILLNALLIPIFDIEGAAIATSTALTISGITLSILMYKNLKIFPWTLISKKEIDETGVLVGK
ncbi:MAG: oligosaccharide flippase family protein [Shewanella sp.]|nr:oligosaccharide flippase family protein [Shewanella sp.]